MKLSAESVEWAIKHLNKEGDTDLFPKPIEIDVINNKLTEVISIVSNIDIGNYKWHSSRRFIVPKDELSHRVITQLDPFDSIILSAIIKEYGQKIEDKRIPDSEMVVFSSRFAPDTNGYLYKADGHWRKFWEYCKEKSYNYPYVLKFDISDFYNQIYHHTIENQLSECGFPNQIINSIKNLLNSVTQRVSRGIPVGPHSTHLLAEMSLIPVDNSFKLRGYNYCRYNDDFVFFCDSYEEGRVLLNVAAEVLDKQQRLTLQRHKTKIMQSANFVEICDEHLYTTPLNNIEEEILKIVKEHTGGDYFQKINYSDLSSEEKDFFSRIYFDQLIKKYLESEEPNFSRIRWIYRRLAQLGIPQAVDFTLDNMKNLIPAMSDICLYLTSTSDKYTNDWRVKGGQIIQQLNSDLFNSNEYFQISLVNLFIYNPNLNHFNTFLKNFPSLSENIKRKIILLAFKINAGDWIREIKEQYTRFDDWNKRALLIAASKLPFEERNFFYKGVLPTLTNENYLEHIIIKWGKEQ